MRHHSFVSMFAAGLLFLVSTHRASGAEPVLCQTANSHACWAQPGSADLNMSIVAVGANSSGLGIACAVDGGTVVNPDGTGGSFGGSVYCFGATGTSGAEQKAIGGYVAGSSYFDPTIRTKRIVSMAIENAPTAGNWVRINVLRSDGVLFAGSTQWPRTNPNPVINFVPFVSNPLKMRSVAFVYNYLVVVTDTSNQQWAQAAPSFTWQVVSQNHMLLAGNQVNGPSIVLAAGADSHTIFPFLGVKAPPSVPTSYGSIYGANTPIPFVHLGMPNTMRTPLAIGPKDAWVLTEGSSTACSGVKPCILRSTTFAAPGVSGWTSWAPFATGGTDIVPVTVQDGYAMRGARGEIWVVDQFGRLRFWAP